MNQNQLQATNNNKPTTFSQFVTGPAVKNKIMELYGSKDGVRFSSAIVSAVTNNPALQECDPMTVLNSAFLGEALKLSPSPQLGHYYMVPFKNNSKSVKDAQFILGYKGYVQLAIRSGQYETISVMEIREGECLGRDEFSGEFKFKFIENEAERVKLQVIGYKGYLKMTNGFQKTIYWSKEKMVEHAKQYSPGYKNDLNKNVKYTFWSKDFDGMAYKTILRQLISKWGIMSIELQQAYNADMAMVDEAGNPVMYPDTDQATVIETNVDNNQGTVVGSIANAKKGKGKPSF